MYRRERPPPKQSYPYGSGEVLVHRALLNPVGCCRRHLHGHVGAATPTFGVGMELNVIAAAVIGGASLKGGSGTILGMALLSVVSRSLILLDVSSYWQAAIRGMILLAAVAIDHLLHSRKRTRTEKPAKG